MPPGTARDSDDIHGIGSRLTRSLAEDRWVRGVPAGRMLRHIYSRLAAWYMPPESQNGQQSLQMSCPISYPRKISINIDCCRSTTMIRPGRPSLDLTVCARSHHKSVRARENT